MDEINQDRVPAELFAPGIQIRNAGTAVTDATYDGVEGARRWRDDLFGVLEPDAQLRLEEATDVGEGRVMLEHRLVGRAAVSGVPFDLLWASIWYFEDGLLARVVGHATRRRALRAVGRDE